jgi:hypothetical protein
MQRFTAHDSTRFLERIPPGRVAALSFSFTNEPPRSPVSEAFEKCPDTLEVTQSVTHEYHSFSLPARRQEFEEEAEAVLVVVLRYVGRHHRLENLRYCSRILWGQPEQFRDEFVTFVSDMYVGSNGFQEVPFAQFSPLRVCPS